jgi:hypothetical protein
MGIFTPRRDSRGIIFMVVFITSNGVSRAVFECLGLAVRAVRLLSTAPLLVCAVGIASSKGRF